MNDELQELHKVKQLVVAMQESLRITQGSLKALEDYVNIKINKY